LTGKPGIPKEAVKPEKNDKINADGAEAFVEFLLSPDTQKIIIKFYKDRFGQPLFIKDFSKDKFGQPLFISDAGKKMVDVGK
jgi:tungstate transport system substrate-binding protein